MYNRLTLLIFLIIGIFIHSCNKIEDKEPNFYNDEYRIGLWITPDQRDTLEFIDNVHLIRKGDFYVHEEYLYRIEGEYLYVRLPSTLNETNHRVLTAEQNRVTLFNMYISIGFGDNSGTFYKDQK